MGDLYGSTELIGTVMIVIIKEIGKELLIWMAEHFLLNFLIL